MFKVFGILLRLFPDRWQDMEMNLFWLGVGGGSLLSIHVLIIIFLRWRTGIPGHGILSVPRFELFLLILMLPCISQSSAFVIRGNKLKFILLDFKSFPVRRVINWRLLIFAGGSTGEIITGALLLAIPAAFILSVCLFLVFTIFSGSFFQYKVVKHTDIEEPWCTKLWFFFTGRPTTGRWFYGEGLSSSFLLRLGILFESWKGPPLFVLVNQNDPNTTLRWTESGNRGIGRMRAISSDDRNEETRSSLSERLLGCAKSSYIILDLLRRVSLGIISGAYSSRKSSQSLFALTITLVQFMYLFSLKPYISRGVQVVESVSLLCEVGIFGLCVSIKSSNPVEAKKMGFVMLSLLFFTFVVQIINEWYGMIKSILRLSQPHKNSFKLGLKFVAKGLVLPFLPRQHWSKVIAATSQPTTGLTPVIPISPETEFERRDRRTPSVHSITSMTATVVPVLSPGQRLGERKKLKEIKHEPKSEMKKLRELAKASFSGDFRGEEASTSYAKAAIPHRWSLLRNSISLQSKNYGLFSNLEW